MILSLARDRIRRASMDSITTGGIPYRCQITRRSGHPISKETVAQDHQEIQDSAVALVQLLVRLHIMEILKVTSKEESYRLPQTRKSANT